jgi:hypothetical protein
MKQHLVTLIIVIVGVLVAHFIASRVPFLNSYEAYEAE